MTSPVMNEQEADVVFADLEADAALDGFDIEGMSEDQLDKRVNTRYPGNLPGKLITIYDTKTGEPSLVLPYMVRKLFRDNKQDDGTPMFSRRQLVTPVVGTLKCLLHPESATRAHYDEIGLGTKHCRKANLRSLFDVERHMQSRHKEEWGLVQRADARAREDEEREFRRVQMDFMRAQAAQPAARKAG